MDGLFGCLGALLAAAFAGLTIVLPIWTFLRIQRLSKSFEQLRVRMAELEETVASARHAGGEVQPATPGPTPAPPAAAPQPIMETTVGSVQPAREELSAAPVETPGAQTDIEPIPTPPDVPTPLPGPARPARTDDTLETRIGGQWLLYIGMAALVFGVGFFVKYAFDNAWVNEITRVVVGAVLGVSMVSAGRRFARRGFELYGHVVAGGGFVALYVSTWASLNLYGLIGRPTAFALMVLITAGAAAMADHQRSRALALVAVLGGFITPALVGGPEDAQVALFTYVAVLVAATMFLASRQSWAWLNPASYVLTLLTFMGWVAAHYTAARYPTTQVFFTIFGLMFGYAFWRQWSAAPPSGKAPAEATLWSVVVLFHLASVLNLFDHSLPLLLYLTLFTLAGVTASVRWDRAWVRLLVFLVTVPVFLTWLDTHNTPGWRVAIVVTAVAYYVMHLAAQGERASRNTSAWERSDLVLFHASALALFAALYRVVDLGWPYSTPVLALGLAGWQGLLAWRLRAASGEAAINALAAAFAMAGFAIGLRFDDWWALVGWAVEAGAIYWAGLRTGRAWMRWGGALLLLAVIARLLKPQLVPANSVIVRHGDRADAMFFIMSGSVEVEVAPRPVRLRPGQFFGEIALVADRARTATITALSPCKLLVLRKEDFERFMDAHPDLKEAVRVAAKRRLEEINAG